MAASRAGDAEDVGEHATIERSLHIEASPDVVFAVISDPAHVREWWADDAEFAAGEPGWLGFGDLETGGKRVRFQVADAVPSRLFSFWWTHEEGVEPGPTTANLVVFELEPSGTGTLLSFRESGFRERGWTEAKAREVHADHSNGWDHFLGVLTTYAVGVAR
ncbi:polyketide cyclase [Nocardioides silvaticus]|uniref:Polyketide cyclase n=1 Tax=Nocardioides silvaticus TaxID=2201891 RepID=A0A316TP11_9ACTN|nr:SRPBCC domain-containing protein [Nocardioides silvaticus]PWN04765.1 polyketide cyclase [Nocardioides silvaticus]